MRDMGSQGERLDRAVSGETNGIGSSLSGRARGGGGIASSRVPCLSCLGKMTQLPLQQPPPADNLVVAPNP